MLETSQDIFYFTSSICLIVFTAFICWAIFYLSNVLKHSDEILKILKQDVDDIHKLISEIKNHLSSLLTHVNLLAKNVDKIIQYFFTKKNRAGKK